MPTGATADGRPPGARGLHHHAGAAPPAPGGPLDGRGYPAEGPPAVGDYQQRFQRLQVPPPLLSEEKNDFGVLLWFMVVGFVFFVRSPCVCV